MDDEEDEANADLTLGILSKAHKRPRVELPLSFSPDTGAFFASEEDDKSREIIDLTSEGDFSMELVKGRGVKRREIAAADEDGEVNGNASKRSKFVVQGKGTSMSDPVMIMEASSTDDFARKKVVQEPEVARKKKKKKNKHKKNQSDLPVETTVAAAVLATDQEESLTVRKLLRQPRYFDPPEDIEAAGATCYNCGEPGHFAAECTAERVRKPCYVCGDFSHEGKNCAQKTECYICGKAGHRAKECPDKGKRGSIKLAERGLCLYCGDSGHETGSCRRNYDPKDLKAIQCYVCKMLGHLCCLDGLEKLPRRASCYNCGATGHTGLGCAKSRNNNPSTPSSKPPAYCYKCGAEGHFARGCSQRPSTPAASAPHCFRCGQEGHFVRDCTQVRWPAPWPAENGAEEDFPRGAKLPRWMEMQMRGKQQQHQQQNHHSQSNGAGAHSKRFQQEQQQQQHRRFSETSGSSSRKQKPFAELVRENTAIRLPKWYEVENKR